MPLLIALTNVCATPAAGPASPTLHVIVVEDPLLTSSAKSQLRRANKTGATAALIIGDDEVSKNEVIWKDLDDKIEQQSLSLDELINKFKKL